MKHDMTDNWILMSTAAEAAEEIRVGGKAAKLSVITKSVFGEVPPWYCVTADLFSSLLRNYGGGLMNLIGQASSEQNPGHWDRLAVELKRVFSVGNLAQTQIEEMLSAYDRLFPQPVKVAVRSSAIGEDSADNSFAGQMESFLNVERSHLVEKILDCFASAFSPAIIRYRAMRQLPAVDIRCAVIIQKMVDSEASGILFTAHPLTMSRSEMVITACYGLGEGAVQDQAETDTYILNASTGQVASSEIGTKTQKVSAAPGGGTAITPVAPELANAAVLSAGQMAGLHAIGKRLELLFGSPQDIEWARTGDGKLIVLQSRPITTLSQKAVKVFDNSNISENYRGATTPLTYSYVRKYYKDIFVGTAAAFGVSAADISRHDGVFSNLVAYLNGGLYYNLENWYRVFAAIPGFRHFLVPFEFGVGIDGTPTELQPKVAELMSHRRHAIKRGVTLVTILKIYLSLPYAFKRHEAGFQRFRREMESVNLPEIELSALVRLYERIQFKLGKNWSAPLINDYFAFIFFHQINVLSKKWGLEKAGISVADLVRTQSDLASIAPINAMIELAATARKNSELSEIIKKLDADCLAKLRGNPRQQAFVKKLDRYIDEYGDRRFDELKLESPTYAENPLMALQLVKNCLLAKEPTSEKSEANRRHAIHQQALKYAVSVLKGQPLKSLLLRLLVKGNQRALIYREYGRLVRSKRCGMERAVIYEIGNRLHRAGAMDKRDDVQYLTVEEIMDYASGATVFKSLRACVDQRKAEFRSYQAFDHDTRIVTGEVPLADSALNITEPKTGEAKMEQNTHTLTGLGCSPGIVNGIARVVHDPANCTINEGEILIAKSTDPAWAYLMVASAGIVVEKGNMLSHAAIISRELGIPCLIGVKDVTRLVREGEFISINGTTGKLEREREYPSVEEKMVA